MRCYLPCLVALLLCTPGCDTDPADDDSGDDDTTATTLTATAEISEVIATVVTVRWTTDAPGTSQVRYGAAGDLSSSTPLDTDETTDHAVVLLGLVAGQSYEFEAVTEAADGVVLTSEIGTVDLLPVPSATGQLNLSLPQGEVELESGYIVTSLIRDDGNWLVILDRDAEIVWYREYPSRLITSIKRAPDGRGLYLIHSDITQTEDNSEIEWIAIDGSDLTVTPASQGHHDAVMFEDHTYGFVAFEFEHVADYAGHELDVAGDTIVELPEGGTEDERDVVFRMFDAYHPPDPACEHGFWSAYNTEAVDWSHGNSLMTLPGDDDSYYLLVSYLDALLKIDRATGTIEWEMYGLHSDFDNPHDDGWSHPHMSHIWHGGMMVFDNGYHRNPSQSRVVEFSWDDEAMTFQAEWIYLDPDGRFNEVLGDAYKMTGGNYLTSWTQFGMLKEIDADGDVLWMVETDIGAAVGRLLWVPDLYELL